MNQYSLYVGIGAGICTAVSMLPQLVKIIKTRKAEDLSYGMVIILLSGILGWIWYGILKKDLPIIVTNGFSLIINLLVLVFSIKYKK
jgi:MtN3 and saliva related transmembrane protein